MINREQLHRDGYVLLRQAIPAEWLDELRTAFDAGAKPSDQWPVPRGWEWLHSQLDTHPRIQAVCRLPQVLAAVGELIGERFFLAHVEGREPLPGVGHQRLHRDMSCLRPGDAVTAMAFFDDYGPDNGATRLVTGTHHPEPDEPSSVFDDESRSEQLSGSAGDILVFAVELLHGASRNIVGARRRSILIGYAAEPAYSAYLETAALRNVKMDTSDRFEPADYSLKELPDPQLA